MYFNLLKKVLFLILFILIDLKLYSKPLDLVIFLEKGGIESYEFQSAYNQAVPAAVSQYLIKAMAEGIPVIASRALVEFICLLPQENSDDDKLKAGFRSNWKEFLDNNLNKLDIYLSKGG